MNTKTKIKIMVDIVMTIIFVLLMDLDFVNLDIHERLGIFSLLLIGVHLFLNKEWVKKIFLKDQDKAKINVKSIINVLTSVLAIVTIGTGILISKTIFNFSVADNVLITFLHIHAAYALGIILLLHVFNHLKYLKAVFQNIYNKNNVGDVKNTIVKILSLIFAGVIIYLAFTKATLEKVDYSTDYTDTIEQNFNTNIEENISNKNEIIETTVSENATSSASMKDTTSSSTTKKSSASTTTVNTDEAVTPTKKEDGGTQSSTTTTSNDTTQQDVQTLSEYLNKLICTGCGKRCLLTAPKCGIGVRQAKAAETEYYQTISSN